MSAYLGDKLVSLTAQVDYNTNDATAGVEDVMQGEVFYNAEGRQVGEYVPPTVDELLPALSNPATAEQILSGYQAIDGTGNKLTGTSNAKVLPSLSNPATADQILSGYQAIDGVGGILTGVMVQENFLATLTHGYEKIAIKTFKYTGDKTVSSTAVAHNLGVTPIKVIVVGLSDIAYISDSFIFGVFSTSTINQWSKKGLCAYETTSGLNLYTTESAPTLTASKVTLSCCSGNLKYRKNEPYLLITLA